MSLKSPLGRVLGLGSAKEGTDHWWMQRVTAVALVPLTLWFVVAIGLADTLDYASVVYWFSNPVNATLMILLLGALLYHSSLGVQVVIEDYVRGGAKVVALVLSKLVHVGLAVAAVFAVIRVSTG
ncbi:MAG: succinate dehydrogenase, hydrophobic membrane anchor protein [Pseudomonadota bacterium]